MVTAIPTIEPFTFQASTAFKERVQIADKLNEVIDAINQIGDIEDFQQEIDSINATITQIQTQIGDQSTEISTLTGQINTLISNVNSLTTRVSSAETDIGAIEHNVSAIQTDIQGIDTEIKGLQGELISEIELVSSPHGSIQVVITHEDESQTASPAIDLGLVQEGGITLQTGSTDRSFKLLITLTDGTSWQTNDFIIPEGGGTDVNITSISISQGTTANQIRFNVGLSDGSTIASNDWNVVTPTEFAALQTTVSGNSSQISNLNGRVTALEDAPSFALSPATATQLGGVKIGGNVTVQADGTISVDLSSYALKTEIPDVSQFITETELIQDLADYMTAEDVAAAYQPKGDYLTEIPIGGTAIGGVKNGGNVVIGSDGTMNAEGGSGEWDEITFTNFPTNWTDDDIVIIRGGYNYMITSPPDNWNTAGDVSLNCNYGDHNNFAVLTSPGSSSNVNTEKNEGALLLMSFQMENPSNLNSSNTTKRIGTLKGWVFNGSTIASNSVDYTTLELDTYIRIWRRKKD